MGRVAGNEGGGGNLLYNMNLQTQTARHTQSDLSKTEWHQMEVLIFHQT